MAEAGKKEEFTFKVNGIEIGDSPPEACRTRHSRTR